MPGMQMPTASPIPQAVPEQNTTIPMPSPSPGDMSGMKGMQNMPGRGSMNMGPLMI